MINHSRRSSMPAVMEEQQPIEEDMIIPYTVTTLGNKEMYKTNRISKIFKRKVNKIFGEKDDLLMSSTVTMSETEQKPMS